MKKLKAYKQAVADFEFAMSYLKELNEKIKSIREVHISNSLTISAHSSERQFIFAIGILNNQLTACADLGMPDKEYRELKNKVTNLYEYNLEFTNWNNYADDLDFYKRKVYELLSDGERFELLQYPTRG